MAFSVEIAPQAFDDLDSIAGFIQANSSFAVAERWFNGIVRDIGSLREMPARCPVAPESDELGREVRILLHGRGRRTYKIYYEIEYATPAQGRVLVFHVRHWAQKPLVDDELQDLIDEMEDEGQ